MSFGISAAAAAAVWAVAGATAQDILVVNARVHTMERPIEPPNTDSFCVRDGRFHTIGSAQRARGACRGAPERDLHGATVLPGLIDTHLHLLSGGYTELFPNLAPAPSKAEVLRILTEYAAAHPISPGGWLTGRGWDQNRWADGGGDFPTRQDLDVAFPDTPLWLTRIDGHAGWANSAALRAVPPFPHDDPEGGMVVRGPDGEPTGVLIDTAMPLVSRHVPPPTPADQRAALRLALARAAEYGLTGAHDTGIDESVAAFYKTAIDEGNYTLRNYAMWSSAVGEDDGGGAVRRPPAPVPTYKGRLTVRAVKIMLDGALGSWGAAMLEPYTDRPCCRGLMRYTAEEYHSLVDKWDAAGYQVRTHAIGDAANRMVLEEYRRACAAKRRIPDKRFRIEHFQIVNASDIARLLRDPAELPGEACIVPGYQPSHATDDMVFAEDRIGAGRLAGAYAWASALRAGSPLPFGSDWPAVGLLPPLLGIHAAVTRQNVDDEPAGGWLPQERVSRYQAVLGYTRDAAWSAFQEDELGTIAEGKLADFTVLDRDILNEAEVRAEDIWKAAIVATFVDGAATWSNPGCRRGRCAPRAPLPRLPPLRRRAPRGCPPDGSCKGSL